MTLCGEPFGSRMPYRRVLSSMFREVLVGSSGS
jgi:hypothetical protein